jgi:hypothetical protein
MTDSPKLGLLAAYKKLMHPLVRILVRNDVNFYDFVEVLKGVFVEVAVKEEFRLPNRTMSDSRIAILTGLNRKEVARQRDAIDRGEPPKLSGNLSRLTRVLVGWHSDPDFTGPYGLPREIPFDSKTESDLESDSESVRQDPSPGPDDERVPTFTELVRRYSGDMAPRAMLDELLRVAAVDQVGNNFRVKTRVYMPKAFLDPTALQRFGEVVRDFISTYEFNIDKQPGKGRFERIVFADDDGLLDELLPAFDALIRKKGPALLNELDNWLSAQELTPTAKNKSAKRTKTGVGIYHYVEPKD